MTSAGILAATAAWCAALWRMSRNDRRRHTAQLADTHARIRAALDATTQQIRDEQHARAVRARVTHPAARQWRAQVIARMEADLEQWWDAGCPDTGTRGALYDQDAGQ